MWSVQTASPFKTNKFSLISSCLFTSLECQCTWGIWLSSHGICSRNARPCCAVREKRLLHIRRMQLVRRAAPECSVVLSCAEHCTWNIDCTWNVHYRPVLYIREYSTRTRTEVTRLSLPEKNEESSSEPNRTTQSLSQ